MARSKRSAKLNFEDVRAIALTMPEVEDTTSYGGPALKVGKTRFAGMAINRSAEPETLGVRVSFEDRARLISARPDIYYITDHYVNYPGVLVRLEKIDRAELREILHLGWQFAMERIPPAKKRSRTVSRK